ncbi:MAG: hypothetical protein IJT34_00050, partial [Butyrivibrio sp.]|nr:hypothetical protein [Butyrivibrio sp.]
MGKHILAREDFSDFAIGEFPYDRDHTATGEYHLIREPGYSGRWVDQVCNYTWNGTGPSWIITELDGRHYMEAMRLEKNRPHRIFPTLQTGEPDWVDYEVSVTVRRLSTKGIAGVCFAMNDSIDTLVFDLRDRDTAELVYRHKEELQVLAQAAFVHDADHSYRLSVQLAGSRVTASVNGREVLNSETPLAARGGRIGITADCPTRFSEVEVSCEDAAMGRMEARRREREDRERTIQAAHPAMKLWKQIDLGNFGTSRQLRFGHLTGTDEWHIVLAQMQKRVARDDYGFISCMTAIDLEGRILWQWGEPSEDTQVLGKVSADMPFQVVDIDGDGADEVIVGRDFRIQILDGRTGAVRKEVPTPLSDDDDASLIGVRYQTYAFDRINPDGIRICNFRGKERPSDILIKDRYCRIYALDENLQLLWKYVSPKNTGHCPLPVDVNGDGRDELLVGYTLLSADGQELWTYPIEVDHTDEIVAGRFRGDGRGYFACVSGTQGFFIGDMHGHIVARDYIGHAQRVSVANYCPERPGFEIAVTNFWGHQGVIYLYDSDGHELWEMENERNGNILAPVNWDGNGSELILTNADPARGGLLDGTGTRAVVFPDDGHPTLCCESIDLCGDERNELVVWDTHRLWIYTQADAPRPQTYHPVQFPHYNASNYRGEYSYP